jgi:hypothetical protein
VPRIVCPKGSIIPRFVGLREGSISVPPCLCFLFWIRRRLKDTGILILLPPRGARLLHKGATRASLVALTGVPGTSLLLSPLEDAVRRCLPVKSPSACPDRPVTAAWTVSTPATFLVTILRLSLLPPKKLRIAVD